MTRLICLLLCLLMAGGVTAQASGQSIEICFDAFFAAGERTWAFPYDDALFMKDADAYSHPLAQSSLGMAIASGRRKQAPFHASSESFFTQAGFTGLEFADYEGEKTKNTIASTIAHKRLPNGETLLAVGVGGLNYGNEWLGNLDIGNGETHRGFAAAAETIVSRVLAYMEKHQIGENRRLWITGYSRAAAVANLTAASLMEQGLFSSQNAYVYSFATPRTTCSPVAYPNVFNIVGKFDPATQIPYAEWGYGRHGVDLFTPSQETDSDYRQRLVQTSAVYEELTGEPLGNSTVVNHNFTIIAEYLTSIIPNASHYDKHMHSHLESVWANPNLSTLRSLLNALSTPVDFSTLSDLDKREQVEDMVEYLTGIVYGIVADNVAGRDGDGNSGAAALLLEHSPDVYIAWLFSSDDPAQVYSEQMHYVHLIVEGDADVTLFDQKGSFVLSVGADGSISEETSVPRYQNRLRPMEDRPLIDASGKQERMLVLPKDQGMPFVIDALSDSDFSYYGVEYRVAQCRPTVTDVRIINMEEGEQYLAFSFTEDGMARMQASDSVWGDSDIVASIVQDGALLSVEVTAELEGFDRVTIDVKTILLIIAGILLLLLLLLILLVVLIIRLIIRVSRRRRNRRAHTA